MFRELEARTVDGVVLRIDQVAARGERRGVVVCLHAMMTDGRYFGARRERGFAQTLAEHGLEVYVADFRGHGRSVPPHAGRDDWSFDDLVELDLPAIVARCAEEAGVGVDELALLGHSLGGLVAAAGLGTGRIPRVRRLGLAAVSVWLGDTLKRRAIMTAYRGITKLLGRAPIRALRTGTADEAASYVDQLTGWSKHKRWTSQRGVDYAATLEAIDVPAFAFVGDGDWMCKPADSRAIAERIPSCERVRVVGTQHGDPTDPDHFTLFTDDALVELRREFAVNLTAARS